MQIDADDFIKMMEEERRNHPVKMNKGLAIECIETQRQFVDELTCEAFDMAIKALKESERAGWIPCSERLPEEPFRCIVTVWDTNPFTMDDFENVLPYFVGWDGEQWNDEDGERCPFEVIAWKAVGEPYRLEGGQDE